jgi:hypothetical protein
MLCVISVRDEALLARAAILVPRRPADRPDPKRLDARFLAAAA